MNILVTGANGQLGRELRIAAQGSSDRYIFSDLRPSDGLETLLLDITDAEAVRRTLEEYAVDAVVNCAAWTDVEGAEKPELYELVEKLNAGAPEILACAMKERDGWLLHISTDYVFGKEAYNTPCREDQTGTPTGIYGLTKLQGEQKIAASGCKHIIIRTAWLYSEYGKNFCRTMLSLTATKASVKVVSDQCGTPTYALDLARTIVEILKRPVGGIYHYSNEGVCSWYDFAKMIALFSGHTACRILPCRSSEFPTAVTRPAYSVLDKTKIKDTFALEIPYWTESLAKCIENLKNL